MPVVVALNRFTTDTDAELQMVADCATRAGVRVALNEVWAKGGEGGERARARGARAARRGRARVTRRSTTSTLPIREKIDTIVREGVRRRRRRLRAEGRAHRSSTSSRSGSATTPVCMAKTQYSLTDDATKLGRPTGFRITVNEVYPAAGAGFVVAQAGDIMTMPGLPKEPAAERMAIRPDGSIVGLF